MKPFKILFSFFAVLFAGIAASAAAATAGIVVNPLAASAGVGTVSLVSELITKSPNGGLGSAAYTAFELTDVVNALGAYCRDENREDILSTLMLDFVPEQSFTIMDGMLDEEPLPNMELAGIVKPGTNPDFQPTADALKFGARIIKVRDCKIDLLLVPKELEKTYLGKYKRRRDDVMEIPFEQYIFDHIAKKANEELRLLALHKGVYNASGTTAADTFSGIDTLLKAERAAVGSPIVPIATGAITEANVITKLLAVYDGLNEALKDRPTIMPVNATIFDWAIRKYEPILNASLIAADRASLDSKGPRQSFLLPGTSCLVMREPGKGTSQFVYATSKSNLFYGTNTSSPTNNIRVQEFDRQIKIMIDFKAGVQVGIIKNNMISMNDQN
jgi:hypothetical protein